MNGALLFVKSGTGCTCDPATPPSPGVVKVSANRTTDGAGTIEGGCDDTFLDSPWLNPGKFDGTAAGVILTFDGGIIMRHYLHFDVELSVDGTGPPFPGFTIGKQGNNYVSDQLMIFGKNYTGDGNVTVFNGTLRIDGNLRMTGDGSLDMGVGPDPVIEINAVSCTEDIFCADNGTLIINANFKTRSAFHLGPRVPIPESGVLPLEIQVASGGTLSLLRDGLTCPEPT